MPGLGDMLAPDAKPETPQPDLAGEPYIALLDRLHQQLKPKTYLEIGTHHGASLAVAQCASIAVDPDFQIQDPRTVTNKPFCALYQQGSDDFFAAVDPAAVLGRPIDLAFLDGMHRCEFLLRDFANTERCCKPNSIIALHDCVPVDHAMVARVPGGKPDAPHRAGWWTGDVWRTLWALRRYRPDLRILTLDAPPTGLVLCTGLDPGSTLLSDRYAEITAAMLAVELRDIGIAEWQREVKLTSTRLLGSPEQITAHFWL